MAEIVDTVQTTVEFPAEKGKGHLSIGIWNKDIILRINLSGTRRFAWVLMAQDDADWLQLVLNACNYFPTTRRLRNGSGADIFTVVPNCPGQKLGIGISGVGIGASGSRPVVFVSDTITAWLTSMATDRIVEALKKTLEPDSSGPSVDDKLCQRRDGLLRKIFN